ncbi:ATP-binding protein [Parachitinimonas caeni]|uniref:ATP-binding protein n=1 Tax=Parachitinimonas caeni TaxID=3031301 RepID=A0ABT7DSF2_9NEIS|nr:ATP-binding protein [Parachitinimonas caeni]MDK2123003.1 ATP-binding protein [Parachitinimonas caeni]
MIYYSRVALAEQLANELRGKALFSDAHNGLFLAAPRRTGKSTFLQADLKPVLEREGVVVVYVDLWSDQRRDPAILIAEGISRKLHEKLGPVARTAKAAGLKEIVLGGLKIDTSRIGQIDGTTLPEALRALHEMVAAPLALIIDEAQHALTSEAGETAMAALKSARDQLNRPGQINLMLVMSGSDRDKLLRLVNTNGSPFYGSQIHRLPELDLQFIAHIAGLIEQQRPPLAPVDQGLLYQAFQLFGCRPQFFMEALGQALSPLASISGRFEAAMLDAARQRQLDDEAQMESVYLGLKPLEQAVLRRLLDLGSRYRPYDAEALKFYRDVTGEKVTAAKVQNALDVLRQHSPALIWKSARGEYSVDDAAMHRWYAQRVTDCSWPPADPLLDLRDD